MKVKYDIEVLNICKQVRLYELFEALYEYNYWIRYSNQRGLLAGRMLVSDGVADKRSHTLSDVRLTDAQLKIWLS